MKRTLSAALLLISGSCDALWGYTKVPTLDNNCQVGGVVCKPYEVCSPDTEQCERQVPKLKAVKPATAFSDGGDLITISGSGFSPDSQVQIDGQPAKMVTVNSAQEISFLAPMRVTPTGWGLTPVMLEVKSGSLAASRMDLISYVSSVAKFDPIVVNNVVLSGSVANLQVGDVDGDSVSDIVARSVLNGEFYVSLGTGNGTFRPAVSAGTGSSTSGHFALIDMDSNQKLDLVFMAGVTGRINYSLSNGNGSFQTQVVLYTPSPATSNCYIGSADLNGDTKKDIVAIDYGASKIHSILADSSGKIGPTSVSRVSNSLNSGNTFPLFADFDHDQKVDLAIVSYSIGLSVFRGNGDATFSGGKLYTGTNRAYAMALTDFNNDGYQDIALSTDANAQMYILRNSAGQDFTSTALMNTSSVATFLMSDDLNGDKNADILVFERNNAAPAGYAFMGYGTGSFITPMKSFKTSFPDLADSRVIDINNDGKLDMIFIKYGDPNAYVILNSLK